MGSPMSVRPISSSFICPPERSEAGAGAVVDLEVGQDRGSPAVFSRSGSTIARNGAKRACSPLLLARRAAALSNADMRKKSEGSW